MQRAHFTIQHKMQKCREERLSPAIWSHVVTHSVMFVIVPVTLQSGLPMAATLYILTDRLKALEFNSSYPLHDVIHVGNEGLITSTLEKNFRVSPPV